MVRSMAGCFPSKRSQIKPRVVFYCREISSSRKINRETGHQTDLKFCNFELYPEMSFEDGSDLASIAAIAESTLANIKDNSQPQQGETDLKEPMEQDEGMTMQMSVSDVDVQHHPPGDSHTNQDSGQPEEAKPIKHTEDGQAHHEMTQDPEAHNVTHEVATTEGQYQAADQQSTYANLQPIFLAMEMGQDAGQHEAEEQHQGETTTTSVSLGQGQVQHIVVSQADGQTSQLVLSQNLQGASMLLNNLTATTAEGGSTPTSLQSILQDVVSGMQTTAGTVPAAIITDPSSSTGSFLIVNQNGVPIVRPVLVSNMSESGGHQEIQVLAGSHGMDEGGEGSQETVTVEVGTNVDSGSAGMVDVDSNLDLDSMRVHQGEGSGDEDGSHARNAAAKRKLSNGPRICEECNKAFKYPSDLKKHLQIHTNIKKFKCEECGRLFRRLHQLNVHSRIHTGEKPYVCNRCGVSFRHDSTLTMHIRTRHDHLRPFKCDECGNTFGRLSHLRKHVRKVCGNRRNKDRPIAQCRFCEENFPTKGDLRKHVLTCDKKEEKVKSKEVTLHVCDQCSKDFASPYNLRRHQLTHTDEKPFQCEVCARQFKEKSSLSKHIKRKHTGVDQGSQTDETGETEFNNVDVIAESAAVSGVSMDDEEEDLEAETSTVDASSLIPSHSVHIPDHQVRLQGTQVIQGDIEMTTIELSLPPGSESHEATALQAAVEALVSASQQQIPVEQESMEVTEEEGGADKGIFEAVEGEGMVAPAVEYQEEKGDAGVQLTEQTLGGHPQEYVTTTTTTEESSPQEQVAAQ
ncbi:zinc finger protein 143 [Nematostella vectensis]|uniref:zinc finger protein 143 n=1 Tax=Nematostella vectensis TaxID=45351 RepID=UPI002077411A|nr:zinc finger protein 143 [Nematostella vectensis]